VIAILALIVGCTRYASQEQLDELQARKDAVAALKTEVKDTQKDIADLMDEQKMKEDELAECKEKIAEIEIKIK
jgi:peptidoglycan hydrolase CwlO-like protein